MTVRFSAKCSLPGETITLFNTQSFGTGGSAPVNSGADTASLSTDWQTFTLTTTVPSISGKTIGSGGNDYLEISFDITTVTDFTLSMANIKGWIGTEADEPPDRAPEIDEVLSKQFFERISTGASTKIIALGGFYSTSSISSYLKYQTKVRPPSLTISNNSDFRFQSIHPVAVHHGTPQFASIDNERCGLLSADLDNLPINPGEVGQLILEPNGFIDIDARL